MGAREYLNGLESRFVELEVINCNGRLSTSQRHEYFDVGDKLGRLYPGMSNTNIMHLIRRKNASFTTKIAPR